MLSHIEALDVDRRSFCRSPNGRTKKHAQKLCTYKSIDFYRAIHISYYLCYDSKSLTPIWLGTMLEYDQTYSNNLRFQPLSLSHSAIFVQSSFGFKLFGSKMHKSCSDVATSRCWKFPPTKKTLGKKTRRWFQPIWKILVKMGIIPKPGVKIKKKWNHHPANHEIQESLSKTADLNEVEATLFKHFEVFWCV